MPKATKIPETASVSTHTRKRRTALVIAGLMIMVLGLSIRAFSNGALADPAGDGLYAVLAYLAVAFLVPGKPKPLVAIVAVTACVTIELFQLTGVPTELGLLWPPLALIFGTTFGATDLIAYTVGVAITYAVDSMHRRQHSQRPSR